MFAVGSGFVAAKFTPTAGGTIIPASSPGTATSPAAVAKSRATAASTFVSRALGRVAAMDNYRKHPRLPEDPFMLQSFDAAWASFGMPKFPLNSPLLSNQTNGVVKTLDDYFDVVATVLKGIATNLGKAARTAGRSAIAKDLAVLSSANATQEEKSASLKFLGHWVGDIHQPLHVSFEDDRGGNNIHVSGKCEDNLHSTWDTCLVDAAVGDDVQAAAAKLQKSITQAKIDAWTKSDPKQWANESFKIAESVQTKYCVKHGDSCDKPSGSVKIDQAYIDANVPIVREQLQKAGIRLAHLLDKALGD
jgi:hypothetical protein